MRELAFETVIEDFFNYKLSAIYTAIPCRIVTVRSSLEDQRVDVQPLVNRVLLDETAKEQPTILNVPVMFPASKKASLTFPIDVGDVVLCVFSQRSTDSFRASTGAQTYTPEDLRKFDIQDAIAIPGLFPFKDAVNEPAKHKWTHSTRDLVIVNNIGLDTECEMRLKENGDIQVKTDQDFYATFNNGLIECNNLTINATGTVTVDAGVNINLTSGASTILDSGANTSITAVGDLGLTAATWTANISGTTTVNAPITNWTGVFNLAGTLAMSGGGGGGTATIDAPLTINNSVTVVGGDVTADGVGLKSHTHSNPEGGSVGPATG